MSIMGLCKCFSIPIVLFLHSCLVAGQTLAEEKESTKLIAQKDTCSFQKQMSASGEGYGDTWMMMPDGNGTNTIAILRPNGNKRLLLMTWTLEDAKKHVQFYLFTRSNPEGEKLDLQNLNNSMYDPSRPTKLISHGWMANVKSEVVTGIRDAYLENKDLNANLIGVDWKEMSCDLFYPNSMQATGVVGQYVGNVIHRMVRERGAKYEDFHLIGHSLGAHVVGFAGSHTKGKIGRITGLDPALPGFKTGKGPQDRLDPSDAQFVDVIHTCSGVLGMALPLGNVDFYPNGGSPYQPGCGYETYPPFTQACSHARSHTFFAESIRHADFKAIRCRNWDQFKNNECEKVYSEMGEYVSHSSKGIYYLKTATSAPFALGINGTIYKD